ncbi:MAG: prolipoprotein diacylglyceryl transferase [Candidatus Aenigmarchaeota archaeon]|nr:prolipoprotein diacylglyceryl transferase [Candidatus Aenigmarchaeota archaeon]
MINFLHSFHPQSILLKIGPLHIYWYGLFVSLGMLLGILVIFKLAKQTKWKQTELFNLFFYLIIVGLVGGRLYEIMTHFSWYWEYPQEIFKVWHGGMGIFGAVIAGLLFIIFYCRRKKISFWLTTDLLAIGLILGQAIGRWGNYFNQEIFGYPTNLPWGIPINLINRPVQYLSATYFHPTFLYESIWSLLVFFFLLLIWQRHQKDNKTTGGIIFAFYLILYGLGRLMMEFIRIDQQTLVFGLRNCQLLALLAIISGLIIMFICHHLINKKIN